MGCLIETKITSVAPLEGSTAPQESPKSGTDTQNTPPDEAPSEGPELPQVTQKPVPEVIRPRDFSRFRATFEVITKEPKGPDYARKQAKELRGLVRSIPSVKEVKILKIVGVDGTHENERSFEIPE
jgi:hypothetical protein